MSRLGSPAAFVLILSALLAAGCGSGPFAAQDNQIKDASQLIEQRKFSEANKLLSDVIAKDPNNKEALFQLSVIDYSAKKYEAALEKLDKAIQLDPGFARAYSQRALVNFRLVRNQSAIDDSNTAIRIDHTDGKTFHRRAIIRIAERQYDEALKDLDESQKLQPEQPAYFLDHNRGLCWMGKHDYTRAISSFNAAAKNATRGQDEVYLRRGLSYARLGDFAAATKDCDKFLAGHPHDKEGMALDASLLSARGEHKAASREFAQIIRAKPDATIAEFIDLGPDRPSFTDFANVGLEIAPPLVVSCLTIVQRSRPLDPEEQLALAKGLMKQHNDRDAQVLLESALASDPSSIAIRVELIRLYARKGLRPKAAMMQAEGLRLSESANERARLNAALR